MPAWQRAYLIACAALTGYALAYMLSAFADWPKLTYLPYERRWAVFDVPPGTLPSPYPGIVVWGLAGFVVAGGLAWLITSRLRRVASRRLLLLAGAWALTAFLLSGLFFTWGLLVA